MLTAEGEGEAFLLCLLCFHLGNDSSLVLSTFLHFRHCSAGIL